MRYTGQLLQEMGEEQPNLEDHSVEQKAWQRKYGIHPCFALLNALNVSTKIIQMYTFTERSALKYQ